MHSFLYSSLKNIRKLSILWKFTIAYFFLIFLPIVFIQVSSYEKSVISIKEQTYTIIRQSVTQLENNILYLMNNCEYASDMLSIDTALHSFLQNEFDPALYLDYNIEQKLYSINNTFMVNFSAILYTSNKSIPEMYNIIYHTERLKDNTCIDSLLKSTKNKKWGRVKNKENFLSLSTEKRQIKVLPLYTKILSLNKPGDTIGIIEIDIPWKEICNFFSDFKIGKNGYLVVAEQDGTILYNGGHEDLRDVISDMNLTKHSDIVELKINNLNYYVFFNTLQNTDLKFLAVIGEKEILQQIENYRRSLFFVIFFGGTAIFFVTYFLTNLLLKRLMLLVKMMKKVESGDFEVRIEDNMEDEIGMLSHSFNSMTEKLHNIILELISKETAQWEAELKALQAQVNPHFLYNTLESLRMECEINNQPYISNALESLGKLFRYSMKWESKLVNIEEEIEHLKNYIFIMKIRYGEKIQFIYNIEEKHKKIKIPKMTLQPLVENCLIHGFKSTDGIYHITVNVRELKNDKILCIDIIDNGIGMDIEKNEILNKTLSDQVSLDGIGTEGIGLHNVNKRIKMYYGKDYGILVNSKKNEGTTVTVCIPLINIYHEEEKI